MSHLLKWVTRNKLFKKKTIFVSEEIKNKNTWKQDTTTTKFFIIILVR